MSRAEAKGSGRAARILPAAAGLAGALYVIAGCTARPAVDLKTLAVGQMPKLEVTAPAPSPAANFTTADGRALSLADFKGKAVVLNLWATWCGPCVEEMPTLARLAEETRGQPLAIVPVSVDRTEDRANALAFLARRPPLAFYGDPSYGLAFAFRPPIAGLP